MSISVGSKVLHVRVGDAIHIGPKVTTSLEAGPGVQMELHQAGVYVRAVGKHILVPYGNVHAIVLDPALRTLEEVEADQAEQAALEAEGAAKDAAYKAKKAELGAKKK